MSSGLERELAEVDAGTLRWALDIVRFLRDPLLPGIVAATGFVVAGFVLLAVTGWQMAGYGYVPLQSPYLLSGGVAGIALILVGLLIGLVLGRRRADAQWDEQFGAVLAEAAALTRAARFYRSGESR